MHYNQYKPPDIQGSVIITQKGFLNDLVLLFYQTTITLIYRVLFICMFVERDESNKIQMCSNEKELQLTEKRITKC